MFLSAELLQEVASFWFQAPLVISSRLREFTSLPGSAMETNRMITEMLSAAAERALQRVGSVKPRTGTYPVVYDERVAASLVGAIVILVLVGLIRKKR